MTVTTRNLVFPLLSFSALSLLAQAEPGQAKPGEVTSGTVTPGKVTPGEVTPGKVSGGTATGGSATGGSATGGSASGGNVRGGSAVGGDVKGGDAVGGSVTGGSATGGSVEGGTATPGRATAGKVIPGAIVPGTSAIVPDEKTHFRARLRPVEGDRISGFMSVERLPEEVRIYLEVAGLEPGSRVAVAFHNPAEIAGPEGRVGPLVDTPMAVDFPEEDLVANDQGRVAATAEVGDPDAIHQLAGKIVALHPAPKEGAGAEAPSSGKNPLALGTLEAELAE